MRLGNLKVSAKLGIAFATMTVAAAIMGAVVFVEMSFIREKAESTQFDAEVLLAAKEARLALARQESSLRGWVITKDTYFSERVKSHYETFKGHLDKIDVLKADDPDAQASIATISQAAAEWHAKVADPVIQKIANPLTSGEALRILTSGLADQFIEPVENGLDAFADHAFVAMEEDFAEQHSSYNTAVLALAIGVGALVLLAGVLAWLSNRFITRPVATMTSVMKTLAAGDNHVEVPHTNQTDEIGQMAQAVLTFKEQAVAKERAEADALEQRQAAEGERSRNEAGQRRSAEEQALVVTEVATGLSKLSAGDLTYRIAKTFPGEYEKLRSDFNAAMEGLQDTMKTIAGATEGIRSGTGEISQASDDLSRRTEQQAASLEETAAALDQITATVKRTAEGANHARDVVSKAKADAEQSGEVVKTAVGAMTEIENSSKQISQIIGVIDEIAFQTNLLALNAGVEAARAGEAGKGFAVVAQEVRALAQRSADAAKEIKGLIQTSTGQVGQGVELVGRTGEALSRIVKQVSEINEIVRDITASAQEQATGLTEVNTAVNQMDQVTQQNAAMVEQATAAAHGLSQETSELSRLVARFRLGEIEAQAAAHAPARKPAAPAPARGRAPVSVGNTALKAEPSEDDWEEF